MTGRQLRAFRESRGLEQVEFALALSDALGRSVDPTTISKWENDRLPLPGWLPYVLGLKPPM